MSAYLVDDEHIRAIVNYACCIEKGSHSGLRAFAPQEGDADFEAFQAATIKAGIQLPPGSLFEVNANRDALGKLLLLANYRSLEERYNEEPDFSHVRSFTAGKPVVYFDRPELVVADLAQAFKTISCYDYQACEVTDFRRTWAGLFVARLQDWLGSFIPGYESAEWGAPKARPREYKAQF